MATPGKKVSAEKVARHFVKKYYQILSETPGENLYKFYKEESSFAHGEGCVPEPTVTGLQNIQKKISDLNLGGAAVNVDTGSIDAQQSKDDDVIVMVTGSMGKKDQAPRRFVQTFVLARQRQANTETLSYYVLNDIFRFLDPSRATSSSTSAGPTTTATVVASNAATRVPEDVQQQQGAATDGGGAEGEEPETEAPAEEAAQVVVPLATHATPSLQEPPPEAVSGGTKGGDQIPPIPIITNQEKPPHKDAEAATGGGGGKKDKAATTTTTKAAAPAAAVVDSKPKSWADLVAKSSGNNDAPGSKPSSSPTPDATSSGSTTAPPKGDGSSSPAPNSTSNGNQRHHHTAADHQGGGGGAPPRGGGRHSSREPRGEEENSRSLYVKALDGQEVKEKEVRALFEPHVSPIRHVNVKGHFAFVELPDAASLSKILSMAQENPKVFYLGDREVTVEERKSPQHRGGQQSQQGSRERGSRREGSSSDHRPSSAPSGERQERGRDRRPAQGGGGGNGNSSHASNGGEGGGGGKPYRNKERAHSGSTGRGEGRGGGGRDGGDSHGGEKRGGDAGEEDRGEEAMVRVLPMRAFRPPTDLAGKLSAPPYDVINSEEARKMADGNEMSFLRVNKPEIDLPPSISPYDLRVYETGARNLQEFIARGWLVQDAAPSYHIYAQRMGSHLQYGICGAVSVEEYATGIIKRHEKTQVKKENDRTRLTYTQNANVGPVFIMYKDNETLDDVVSSITSSRDPETRFTASDGVEHMVWPVAEEDLVQRIKRAFESVRYTYIADGHHRSASAFRVGEMKIKAAIADGRNVTGEEPFCYFLAVLFPANQLKILEYNRVVKDLNGLTEEEYLRKLSEKFDVRPLTVEEPKAPPRKGEIGMCLRGSWYRLTAHADIVPSDDPVNSLDVQLLYHHCLHSLLGIGDPREDERIKYVGGIRGASELERLVHADRGWGVVAFCMYPVAVEEVMAIADVEGLMPPKATWFEPKLRSGLIVRLYDNA